MLELKRIRLFYFFRIKKMFHLSSETLLQFYKLMGSPRYLTLVGLSPWSHWPALSACGSKVWVEVETPWKRSQDCYRCPTVCVVRRRLCSVMLVHVGHRWSLLLLSQTSVFSVQEVTSLVRLMPVLFLLLLLFWHLQSCAQWNCPPGSHSQKLNLYFYIKPTP